MWQGWRLSWLLRTWLGQTQGSPWGLAAAVGCSSQGLAPGLLFSQICEGPCPPPWAPVGPEAPPLPLPKAPSVITCSEGQLLTSHLACPPVSLLLSCDVPCSTAVVTLREQSAQPQCSLPAVLLSPPGATCLSGLPFLIPSAMSRGLGSSAYPDS